MHTTREERCVDDEEEWSPGTDQDPVEDLDGSPARPIPSLAEMLAPVDSVERVTDIDAVLLEWSFG